MVDAFNASKTRKAKTGYNPVRSHPSWFIHCALLKRKTKGLGAVFSLVTKAPSIQAPGNLEGKCLLLSQACNLKLVFLLLIKNW